MTAYLEIAIDKFIFKVATDRLYTSEGLWVKKYDSVACIGITDFFQQRNGDMAFVHISAVGTELKPGDELASVETIKVNLSLPSPVSGTILNINNKVVTSPEFVNQHPYTDGWLCELTLNNWEKESKNLLSPNQYVELMKKQAKEETN